MVQTCYCFGCIFSGAGVVSAILDRDVVRRLASAPPISTEPANPGPVSWSTIMSHRWCRQEHINILELRAVSSAVGVLSHPQSLCRRLLLLSDSQVAIGALSKGRS